MIPTPLVEQLSTALARWTVAGRATTTRSKRVRRSPMAITVQVDLQVDHASGGRPVGRAGSGIGVRSWPSCPRVPPFFIWMRRANDVTRGPLGGYSRPDITGDNPDSCREILVRHSIAPTVVRQYRVANVTVSHLFSGLKAALDHFPQVIPLCFQFRIGSFASVFEAVRRQSLRPARGAGRARGGTWPFSGDWRGGGVRQGPCPT
jgi:hypothetical protein